MELTAQQVVFERPDNSSAAYEHVCYVTADGGDMMRQRYVEVRDDIFERLMVTHSRDHGRTWAEGESWPCVRGSRDRGDGPARHAFYSGCGRALHG